MIIKKVMFVGLGTITQGIINNILSKTNIKVSVYSRSKVLKKHNFICSDNLDLCIRDTDIIISCVPDDEASRSFWFNETVREYIEKYKTFSIELSTLSYNYICKWYQYIEENNGKAIECPFTGSRGGAEKGTLSLFICSDYYNDLKDFFTLFSSKIYQFPLIGEPSKFKLFYNTWGAALLYQLAEFYPVIEREFTDTELVEDIISNDGWMAPVCSSILPRVKAKKYDDVNFKYKYMVKDINYANDLFLNYLPIFEMFREKYNEYNTPTVENLDFSVLIDLNLLYILKKQIVDYIEKNDINCSVFFTGSYGRGELRYNNEGLVASDIDILVVIEEYDEETYKKFKEYIVLHKNEYKNLSFILCLKKNFIDNIYSNYRLSTDIKNPIYNKLNVNLKLNRINKNDFFRFGFQPVAYYYTKFLRYGDYCDLYKFILESLKILFFKVTKTEEQSYVYNKQLLNYVKKNLSNGIITYEKLESLLANYFNGNFDSNKDEVMNIANNLLSAVRELYDKYSEKIKLKSVQYFFNIVLKENKNNSFEIIRNYVFIENQGLCYENAIIK